MNMKRVVIAGIGGWIVALLLNMLAAGILASEISRYPGVFRTAHQASALAPMQLIGSLVAMLATAYMYAKGYEGGSGIVEGGRFGFVLGLFVLGFVAAPNYTFLNIGGRLWLMGGIVAFIGMIVVGCVIGALYKPAMAARPARV